MSETVPYSDATRPLSPTAGGAPADSPREAPGATPAPGPTITALDRISEGIVILDRDWRFVYANAAAERLVRKSRSELLGRNHWELFPEAEGRGFGGEYRRAVADNIPAHFEEFYPEPLNAWYEVRAYPGPDGLSIVFRDVTRRRAAEDALRESEARYRSLFSNMAQGAAVLESLRDADGTPRDSRFLDVNPAFERLTGLSRDQLLGRLGSEVFPGDHAVLVEVCGRVAITGEPVAIEHRSAASGGYSEVVAYSPAPGQFAVVFHDITERKRLEADLRVNLTKYRVLLDSFPVGISVTDAAGQVIECNPASERVLGASREQLLSHRVGVPQWQFIRSDGSPMSPEEFASVRAFREQAAVEDVETGLVRPGMGVTWLSVSAAPIPLDGYGVVITYGDITRRRMAEAALRQNEARHQAILQTAMDGFWLTDAEGHLLEVNDAYCQMSGYTEQELLGIQISALEAAEGAGDVAAHIRKVMASGDDRFESRHRRKDGGTIDVEVSVQYRPAEGGQLVAFLRDITERKRVEQQLQRVRNDLLDEKLRLEVIAGQLSVSRADLNRANEDLQVANEALRLSNESLEARVEARTADLARRTAQLQALAVELTRAEVRERQRVAQIMHDGLQQLLSVARMNLGLALERVADAEVGRLLSDTDDLLAHSLGVTRSLTAELSPGILQRSGLAAALRWLGRWYKERFGLDVSVDADTDVTKDPEARMMLFRAVRELLFNIVKHARVTNAHVRLDEAPGGRARIVVSDDGVGFDPGALWEEEGERETFGLFSIRERLELLGGRFEAQSAPGQGTTVTIVGPSPGPPSQPTPPQSDAAPPQDAVRRASGSPHGRRQTSPLVRDGA